MNSTGDIRMLDDRQKPLDRHLLARKNIPASQSGSEQHTPSRSERSFRRFVKGSGRSFQNSVVKVQAILSSTDLSMTGRFHLSKVQNIL